MFEKNIGKYVYYFKKIRLSICFIRNAFCNNIKKSMDLRKNKCATCKRERKRELTGIWRCRNVHSNATQNKCSLLYYLYFCHHWTLFCIRIIISITTVHSRLDSSNCLVFICLSEKKVNYWITFFSLFVFYFTFKQVLCFACRTFYTHLSFAFLFLH